MDPTFNDLQEPKFAQKLSSVKKEVDKKKFLDEILDKDFIHTYFNKSH
jgi:hypothetical protein